MKKSKVVMDIAALESITHYCHYIPITRGLHLEFFAENYPGWDWNDFVPKLIERGILVRDSKESNSRKLLQGLYISRDVELIEFTPGKNEVAIRVIQKKRA